MPARLPHACQAQCAPQHHDQAVHGGLPGRPIPEAARRGGVRHPRRCRSRGVHQRVAHGPSPRLGAQAPPLASGRPSHSGPPAPATSSGGRSARGASPRAPAG
eukprot:2397843-Lingulodinium_polyedra.AAC.1